MIHDLKKTTNPPDPKQKAIFETGCYVTKPICPTFAQKMEMISLEIMLSNSLPKEGPTTAGFPGRRPVGF